MDATGLEEWPVQLGYHGLETKHSNDYSSYRGGDHPHMGVDINQGQGSADLGAPVLATHNGTVKDIRHFYGEDKNAGGTRVYIAFRHNGKIIVETRYMHLNSVTHGLKVGDRVYEGQQIGTIGGTGAKGKTDYGPHLHYELRVNDRYEDPRIGKDHLKDPQKIIDSYMDKQNTAPTILRQIDVVGQKPKRNILVPSEQTPYEHQSLDVRKYEQWY